MMITIQIFSAQGGNTSNKKYLRKTLTTTYGCKSNFSKTFLCAAPLHRIPVRYADKQTKQKKKKTGNVEYFCVNLSMTLQIENLHPSQPHTSSARHLIPAKRKTKNIAKLKMRKKQQFVSKIFYISLRKRFKGKKNNE